MLPAVDGEAQLAEREQAFLVSTEMRNVIVFVEGTSVGGNIDCTITMNHIRFQL
jgi:hypothetical protein